MRARKIGVALRNRLSLLAVFSTISMAHTPAWASCALPADHQQTISIEACGASSASSDNKKFIDEALEAAANRFMGIYVPPGVFFTSGDHIPPSGVGVYGSGTLKLTANSRNPIINTAHSHNTINGVSFDLSASTSPSRAAIDIDGGSSGTVVSDVTVNYGRIMAFVTNGGAPPTQIEIRHNALTSAITGGTSGGAIDINSGTSHFSVIGNRVNGNWNGKSPVQKPGDGTGIDVETGASYGQIAENDTYANTGSGIYLLSAQFITVSGNNCSGNRQSGIGVNSDVVPRPGRLTISGNVCSQNQYDGIDVNEGGPIKHIYISIQGNYLASNGPAPGGGGTGIFLAYAANVVVSANTIFDNSVAGIWLNSSENVVVVGNTISSNSRTNPGAYPGMLLINSSHNPISGNLFTNAGGNSTQSYAVEERGPSSDYNNFTGNNIHDNIKDGLHLRGPHDATSGNL
jgi:parallel beta-helix repeat protein